MSAQKPLVRIIIELLSVSLLGRLLQIFAAVVLARVLAPEGFGVYALAIAWSFVVVRFSGLGWPVTVNRLIPKFRAEESADSVKGVLLFAYATTTVSVITVVAILLIISETVAPKGDIDLLLLAISVIIPFLALRVLLKNTLAALGAPRRGIALEDSVPSIVMLLLVGLSVFCNVGIVPLDAAIFFAFANLISSCFGLWWTKNRLLSDELNARPVYDFGDWLTRSLAAMWGQSARLLVNRADVIMLGAFSSLTETGLYAVALRLCQLLPIPSAALQTYLSPRLSETHTQDDRGQRNRLYKISLLFALGSSMPLAALFTVGADHIVGFIFGPEFANAASLVGVLALAKVCQAVTNSTSGYLLMTDRESIFSQLTTTAMIVNIILNVLLIPSLGARGAALATLFSAFTLVVSQLWVSRAVFSVTKDR